MAWVITLIYGLGDNNELNDADIKNTQRFVRQNKPVYICEPMQKNAVYKKKQRPVESIPPTANCLKLHVMRAMLQSR